MISSLNPLPAERAQPWLGTLVNMQVTGLAQPACELAFNAAFQEVAIIQRLMSFHDPASDLSRLNAASQAEPVEVHPYTWTVLRRALEISAATQGCFDITIGSELVAWELLPRPAKWLARSSGSWRDIELCPDGRVCLHRPLCLDLGGIAKGFAVDKATEVLQERGATRSVVNAGGDLRVRGAGSEWVALAAETSPAGTPVLEVEEGSVASSGSRQLRHVHPLPFRSPHVDGVSRTPARPDRFVSVLCEECLVADALTKVVLVEGERCQPVLELFNATAYLHDPGGEWQCLPSVREPGISR